MISFNKKLWVGILVLAVIAPLGIIVPHLFKAKDAWGEWGTETIQKLIGFIPEGMKRTADRWQAPVPDYSLGGENTSLTGQSGWYILSAMLGIILVGVIMYLISRIVIKRKE